MIPFIYFCVFYNILLYYNSHRAGLLGTANYSREYNAALQAAAVQAATVQSPANDAYLGHSIGPVTGYGVSTYKYIHTLYNDVEVNTVYTIIG